MVILSCHWKNDNCSININLTHKISLIFLNLKNYDSHHILQNTGAFGVPKKDLKWTQKGWSVGPVKKLVTNLLDKERYFLHYKDLQLYLKLGIVFDQPLCFKPYIDFNTEKRKIFCNVIKKRFFKLMNNSVWEKTKESLKNIVDEKLAANSKDYLKLVSKLNFASQEISKGI